MKKCCRFGSVCTKTMRDNIMVGGFAINLHGYTRTTKDIDSWIEDTLDNREKLRKALKEQGSGRL